MSNLVTKRIDRLSDEYLSYLLGLSDNTSKDGNRYMLLAITSQVVALSTIVKSLRDGTTIEDGSHLITVSLPDGGDDE